MNMHWYSSKTDCTIEEYKLSNTSHAGRNNYQVTFIFMENEGKSLITTEKMKIDEHALVLIKNRLHQ